MQNRNLSLVITLSLMLKPEMQSKCYYSGRCIRVLKEKT